jgi:hypothetical protein
MTVIRAVLAVTAVAGLVTTGLAANLEVAAQASALQAAAPASPTPPFKECPAVGYNTSCSLLIDVETGGISILDDPAATLSTDPTPGTYDGADDTLVGIINNTSAPLSQISLSSPTEPIFGFDGDGICANPNPTSGLPGLPASDCAGVNHVDTTGYGGPNTYFTNISADAMSGVVNFIIPLAPGQSTYFSLEEALQPNNFIPPTSVATSLSGGGHSGASVTVSPGTAVTDSATLTGTNAAKATGTVAYNVYSDKACTKQVSAGTAQTITSPGTLPSSAAEKFSASGTYYWQVAYSGDASNGPSVSPCGSEIETVSSTPATLKVCKVAGPGVKVGTDVSFTAGTHHVTVPAGPAPGGYCDIVPGKFFEGDKVTVTELIPNTMAVTAIASSPPGLIDAKNVKQGYVTDTLGSGVTEVTFTDEVVKGAGYTEICNSATNGTGHYSFTYDGLIIKVPVNACSPALKVHAGALTIRERRSTNPALSTCQTRPAGRLLQCYPITRTAVVAIVPGNDSTETIVKFVNS